MSVIKRFELFIKESNISEDDDMFVDFKDLGLNVREYTIYYTDEGMKRGSRNDKPTYQVGEKKGTLITIEDKDDDYITLESYIEKQKSVLEVLDKIIYRTNAKVLISNSYPDLIFEESEHITDNSKLLLELKKEIINFINDRFPQIDKGRHFEIEDDATRITIRFDNRYDIHSQFELLKSFMNSKKWRDRYSLFKDKKVSNIGKTILSSGSGYTNGFEGDLISIIHINL